MSESGAQFTCPTCGDTARVILTTRLAGNGRPSTCTPEATAKFLEAIPAAKPGTYCSLAALAELLGISEQTLRRVWIKRGRAGVEPYATFLAACIDAAKASSSDYSDLMGIGFFAKDDLS